jgi:outer membrane receptor protein involved in Fe transport
VFHTTIANLQVLGPPATAGSIALVVKNFGDVSASGFELEGNYLVGYGLSVGAGVGYSDPKFEAGSLDFNDGASCAAIPTCAASRLRTVNGQQAVDLHGLKPPYESDWTFNTTVKYEHALGIGNFSGFVRGDYRYESRQYNTVTNFAFYGPRQNVNLHAGVENDTWAVTLFMLNATNNLTPVTNQANGILNGFDPPPYGVLGVTWIPTSALPEGRTYGIKLAYHY